MSSNVVVLTDEAARVAITELCLRREPAEAKKAYSVEDWEKEFERPWVLTDERYLRTSTEVEGSGRAIYCRICVQPKKHGKVAAFKLYVSYEDDVMKVAKHGLIHMQCHNCNFDMHVQRRAKVRAHEFSSLDEAGSIDAAAYAQIAQRVGKSKYATATEVRIRQAEQLRQLHEMQAQGFPQEHLEKLVAELERQHREYIANHAVALPIKYPLDPNKWPGV